MQIAVRGAQATDAPLIPFPKQQNGGAEQSHLLSRVRGDRKTELLIRGMQEPAASRYAVVGLGCVAVVAIVAVEGEQNAAMHKAMPNAQFAVRCGVCNVLFSIQSSIFGLAESCPSYPDVYGRSLCAPCRVCMFHKGSVGITLGLGGGRSWAFPSVCLARSGARTLGRFSAVLFVAFVMITLGVCLFEVAAHPAQPRECKEEFPVWFICSRFQSHRDRTGGSRTLNLSEGKRINGAGCGQV
jgi:preprotein translocase subunit SecG